MCPASFHNSTLGRHEHNYFNGTLLKSKNNRQHSKTFCCCCMKKRKSSSSDENAKIGSLLSKVRSDNNEKKLEVSVSLAMALDNNNNSLDAVNNEKKEPANENSKPDLAEANANSNENSNLQCFSENVNEFDYIDMEALRSELNSLNNEICSSVKSERKRIVNLNQLRFAPSNRADNDSNFELEPLNSEYKRNNV